MPGQYQRKRAPEATPGELVLPRTNDEKIPSCASPVRYGRGSGVPEWMVTVLLSLACVSTFWSRSVLGIVMPEMANEFDLSSERSGAALSAFFYGYFVANTMAGSLLRICAPANLVLFSVLGPSVCTTLLPAGVGFFGFYGLVACRLFAGLTQGCFFPSVYSLLAAEFPSNAQAKTRILTALNGLGLLGIASSFLASPLLERVQLPRALVVEGFHGWRLAILAAGVPGFPWCLAWATSKLFKCSTIAEATAQAEPVDYETIMAAKPFRAIVCGHFAHNWASIIVMAWLPMYLSEELELDGAYLSLACMPYLLMVVTSPIAGIVAAAAIKSGTDLWKVRSVMGVIGLIGPAIGLLIFPRIPTHLWQVALMCISVTMALTTCVSASVHASILDICGPMNSGAVFSIANAISVLPGFFGVQAVGYLHESWGWRGTFGMCSVIYCFAALAYTHWGSAERIWD